MASFRNSSAQFFKACEAF